MVTLSRPCSTPAPFPSILISPSARVIQVTPSSSGSSGAGVSWGAADSAGAVTAVWGTDSEGSPAVSPQPERAAVSSRAARSRARALRLKINRMFITSESMVRRVRVKNAPGSPIREDGKPQKYHTTFPASFPWSFCGFSRRKSRPGAYRSGAADAAFYQVPLPSLPGKGPLLTSRPRRSSPPGSTRPARSSPPRGPRNTPRGCCG